MKTKYVKLFEWWGRYENMEDSFNDKKMLADFIEDSSAYHSDVDVDVFPLLAKDLLDNFNFMQALEDVPVDIEYIEDFLRDVPLKYYEYFSEKAAEILLKNYNITKK